MGVSAWFYQTASLVVDEWAEYRRTKFNGVPLFLKHENLCLVVASRDRYLVKPRKIIIIIIIK